MAGIASPPAAPNLYNTGAAMTNSNNTYTNTTGSGQYTAGTQPAGNNYPAGIYGPGPGGSGTALGLLTPQDLTSANLTSLLNTNSPYIQQARIQATNQANSRGLANSSIAAGNAQAAAIQAGLPIASGDAQAALGLQETNLGDLSKAQTAQIGADATTTAAATSAAAQRYIADTNNAGELLRQREDLAFTGEQNQLGYQRQLGLQNNQGDIAAGLSNLGYDQNSALSAQNYGQNLGLDQFNLAGTLLQGQQNFFGNAGIAAMSNPAIMGDPTSFGGYLQFLMNPFSQAIDNMFSNIFGQIGGQ